MIDAYEVGIQLALQDGVSAGLEVIGRELAEVDRAIAATNAGLLALTQTAQSAARAVVAAAGSRVPAAVPPAAGESAPGGEARSAAQTAGPQTVAAPSQAAPNADLVRSGGEAPPRAMRGDADLGSAGREQAVTRPAAEATASVAPTVDRAAVPDASGSPAVAAESIAPSAQPQARVTPAADPAVQGTAPVRESVVPQPVPVLPSQAADAPAKQQAPLMRASVAQAIAPQARRETVTRETGSRGVASVSMPVNVALPQTPASPGNEGPQGMAAPMGGAGSLERGAAPQPQARERSEGGGGSVMLDGRLVGYWLTEQMARDAARPPGGTSFFDPRQSPAWTPSGAL